MYKRGWGWSQFRVTFLKMDLTYLDFTILVGCVSLPLEAIIRAHLLQSFLFLLEQRLWSVAGLFCYFFLLSLSRRGQYCFADSPHPEFWTMTMDLRSSGSALLIMWFVSLSWEWLLQWEMKRVFGYWHVWLLFREQKEKMFCWSFWNVGNVFFATKCFCHIPFFHLN